MWARKSGDIVALNSPSTRRIYLDGFHRRSLKTAPFCGYRPQAAEIGNRPGAILR